MWCAGGGKDGCGVREGGAEHMGHLQRRQEAARRAPRPVCAGALQVMLTSRLWWDDWATRVQWEQPKSRSKRCCLLLSRLS